MCRLGLATRGNTHLRPEDVELALDRGLNYLNWCGKPDGLSKAVAGRGRQREDFVVAVQFQARTAAAAEKEFASILNELRTDYLDIATLYYVESAPEWREITASGGVWDVLARHKKQGALRMIGLTSHQRKLAASWAGEVSRDGAGNVIAKENAGPKAKPRPSASVDGSEKRHRLDMLMIRYNLAHRGAEHEVFPATTARQMPVVTFTGLRWKALLGTTPDDPPGFEPPKAADCYRFCLSNPAVTVALAAPGNRRELEETLTLLDDWRESDAAETERWRAHGDRVRKHAGEFW